MKCICGCEEKAVCVISGRNPKGDHYEMGVCDPFAGYVKECAGIFGLPFERRLIPVTEDSSETEAQMSDGPGHLEPPSFPR